MVGGTGRLRLMCANKCAHELEQLHGHRHRIHQKIIALEVGFRFVWGNCNEMGLWRRRAGNLVLRVEHDINAWRVLLDIVSI